VPEFDAFLAEVIPRMSSADTLLHNGDATQRTAMWSRRDPVTLFGAALSATSWREIRPIFRRLESRFSNCSSWDFDLLAAGVSDGIGYTVGIERTTASVDGGPAASYALRVTTIFRREDGQWLVVHRHADAYDAAGGHLASTLRGEDAPGP
jgi:ketosteroid isomerase-like protein